MSATDALLLLTWVAIALLALAMSTLLRRLTLLESGVRPAAALELGPPVGSTVSKDVLRAINCDDRTTTTSLLFVSPSCATCDDILAALRQGSRLADGLVVLSSAPPIPLADGVAVRDGSRLFAELGIPVTPFILAVAMDGSVLASRPVFSWDDLVQQLADVGLKDQGVLNG